MGAIVTRTNVACGNVSVAVVPCSYFGVPNFISILMLLLKKISWGFMVDVVFSMGKWVFSVLYTEKFCLFFVKR